MDETAFIDLLVLMMGIDKRRELRKAGAEKGIWIG